AALPVVTSAMGGALEIVDDTCGSLLPPGDRSALAESLGKLIQDSKLRGRLGAAGPGRARQLCDPATQLGELKLLLGTKLGERSYAAAGSIVFSPYSHPHSSSACRSLSRPEVARPSPRCPVLDANAGRAGGILVSMRPSPFNCT